MKRRYQDAFNAWQMTLRLQPSYTMAQNAINILSAEIAKAQQSQQQAQQQQQKPGK
jgi:cytochrome c-type biogenesis protein CcmH/NrfG